MNGSPNSALNVGTGSTMPCSVPATFAVKPVRKWYMAASGVKRAMGGSTPNASAVRNTTTEGGCPTPSSFAPSIWPTG